MTCFVVEKQKVVHNIDIIKKHANEQIIFAVLKGNAYGLGLETITEVLLEQGITHFAVADPTEAIKIREISEDAEILMMSPVYDEDELLNLVNNHIIVAISSAPQAVRLQKVCADNEVHAEVHIEIDTGMGRYGFLCEELSEIKDIYLNFENIKVSGIFTHMYSGKNSKTTGKQIALFRGVISALKESDIEPGITHAANSVTLFSYPDISFDAVRVGSAITGRIITTNKFGLKKVGFIESVIHEIRVLPKGHNVGYGGIYKTKKATKIGVIPVGYCHGFSTEKGRDSFRMEDTIRHILGEVKRHFFGDRIVVTINGVAAPIIGHIGMISCIVNIDNMECNIGDTVSINVNPLVLGSIIEIVYR